MEFLSRQIFHGKHLLPQTPFFLVLLLACFLSYKLFCFVFHFGIKVFLKKKRTAQILSELEAVEEKLNISTKKRIHFLANINPSSDEFS